MSLLNSKAESRETIQAYFIWIIFIYTNIHRQCRELNWYVWYISVINYCWGVLGIKTIKIDHCKFWNPT